MAGTFRIKKMHCAECGHFQRARFRLEGDEEIPPACTSCGGKTWLALPQLRHPSMPEPLYEAAITLRPDMTEMAQLMQEWTRRLFNVDPTIDTEEIDLDAEQRAMWRAIWDVMESSE